MQSTPPASQQSKQPWYHSKRLWLTAVSWAVALPLLASFSFTTAFFAGSPTDTPYDRLLPLMQAVLAIAVFTTYLGLVVQTRKTMLGIRLVTLGLFLAALSLTFPAPLGLVVLCYEARFIAANVPTKRTRWLLLIYFGVIFTFCYHFCGELLLRHQHLHTPELTALEAGILFSAITLVVLFSLAIIQAFWFAGRIAYQRQREMHDLKAKAEFAAIAERNRIAREMHDIIAHSLTVVIAQADGGRFAAQKSPEQAVQALTTIAEISRQSLTQMRQLLSVLHNPAEQRQTSANPGLENLAQLFQEANGLGLKFTGEITGERPQLGEAMELTVYRIVQEIITNALKHAAGGAAQLRIDYGTAHTKNREINITIDTTASTATAAPIPGSGRGLTGIRERAKLYGGTCYTGTSLKFPGGFHLLVRIPLPK